MENTPRLNLKRPAGIEYVNIHDLNANSDAIDQFALEVEGELANVPDLETSVADLILQVGSLANLSTIEKTNLVSAINEVYTKLTTHQAEKATLTKEGHVQLSNATNSTSDTLAATPSAVKAAMDRADAAFTSASNGKQVVGNAITGVDDSVVIPTDPTFQQLADAIGSINPGILYAEGKIVSNSGTTPFPSRSGSNISHSYVSFDMSMLDFVPTLISFTAEDKSGLYETTWFKDNYIDGGSGEFANVSYSTNGYRAPYVNGVVNIPVQYSNRSFVWKAYE